MKPNLRDQPVKATAPEYEKFLKEFEKTLRNTALDLISKRCRETDIVKNSSLAAQIRLLQEILGD